MMIKYNFIQTLTAGVALATAFYPQARAADTGSCGTNCQYTYSNGTIIYSPIDPSEEAIINRSNSNYGLSGPISNAIVSEGIVSIQYDGTIVEGSESIFRLINSADGKLVLPKSLGYIGNGALYNCSFGTIEINSENLSVAANSLRFIGPDTTIVMSADADIEFHDDAFKNYAYGHYYYPSHLTISCKGNPNDCEAKFGKSLNRMGHYSTTLSTEYYNGLDEYGNYVEYSQSGLAVWEDSTKMKPLARYDVNGKAVDIYKYDGAGNLIASYENGIATYKKTSYTPSEAAAAVKKGNKNKVTLTFK